MNLKLDSEGHVATQPLTDFSVAELPGIGILLVMEYLQEPRELGQGGAPQHLQLLLSPSKAVLLAALIARTATGVLIEPSPGKVQ
jgi:hypothetical protein